MPEKSLKQKLDSVIIKSKANKLTKRVFSRAYAIYFRNLAVSVYCLTCRIARTFTALTRRAHSCSSNICIKVIFNCLRGQVTKFLKKYQFLKTMVGSNLKHVHNN